MTEAALSVLTPDQIMAESFRIIDAEVGVHPFDALQWPVVRRIIHASGDLELARLTHFQHDAAWAGVRALQTGLPIVTDVRMVASGIRDSVRSHNHGVVCVAGPCHAARESWMPDGRGRVP